MMSKAKNTVLITGGAGFIGSHLVDHWLGLKSTVVVLDDLSRGSLNNLKKHSRNKSLVFIQLDLADQNNNSKLLKIIEDYKPDTILHFAAINGTEHFYENSYKVSTTNSLTTLNLISTLALAKQKSSGEWQPKFVYASTSEVYGDPEIIPTPETARTDLRISEKRDSYAAAKLMGEFYAKLGCEKSDIPWLIVRIFNVYGPRMISTKYGQVIPEFIQRLNDGEQPLKIIGSGQHTRSFNHIDDFVILLNRLLNANPWNEVINLGNHQEISINELALKVCKSMGVALEITHSESRAGDHMRRCPDIDKLLGYVGNYEFKNLDTGILEMIELN